MRIALTILAAVVFVSSVNAQAGRPDPAVQKAAMEKLRYLAGTWEGDASVAAGPGKEMKIRQTEQVQYRLDGMLLVIEGTGRDDAGKVVFNAFAIVSFDQATGKYKMRAWNAGNFVETDLKLTEKGFDWGFQQGPVTMISRMHVDEQGRWAEDSETGLNDGRKLHSVKMLLSRK